MRVADQLREIEARYSQVAASKEPDDEHCSVDNNDKGSPSYSPLYEFEPHAELEPEPEPEPEMSSFSTKSTFNTTFAAKSTAKGKAVDFYTAFSNSLSANCDTEQTLPTFASASKPQWQATRPTRQKLLYKSDGDELADYLRSQATVSTSSSMANNNNNNNHKNKANVNEATNFNRTSVTKRMSNKPTNKRVRFSDTMPDDGDDLLDDN